jgi:hypothetical protein
MALLLNVAAPGATPLLPQGGGYFFSDSASYPNCELAYSNLNQLFHAKPLKSCSSLRNISAVSLENTPSMIVGDSVTVPDLSRKLGCRPCVAVQLLTGSQHTSCPETTPNQTVVYRVERYDACNPYESMHAKLNLFVAMERLQLKSENLQIVLTDSISRAESCAHDAEFWQRVNPKLAPLYFNNTGDYDKKDHERRLKEQPFRGMMIEAAGSGESLLCTKSFPKDEYSMAVLPGRMEDMQCQLPVLKRFRDWNIGLLGIGARLARLNERAAEQGPQMLWISRATSLSRYLVDEQPRLEKVGTSLGVPITVLDVERYSLKQVASLVGGVSVLAGAHGAGLAWLLFLPQHGAVIEMFGGDRPPINRHYHNMAVMLGLGYYELTAGGGGDGDGLECGEFGGESACAASLAGAFRSALAATEAQTSAGAVSLASVNASEARMVRFAHSAPDGKALARPCEILPEKPYLACSMFYEAANSSEWVSM